PDARRHRRTCHPDACFGKAKAGEPCGRRIWKGAVDESAEHLESRLLAHLRSQDRAAGRLAQDDRHWPVGHAPMLCGFGAHAAMESGEWASHLLEDLITDRS